jgi:tetratricopeptide (TPR) repeat protein
MLRSWIARAASAAVGPGNARRFRPSSRLDGRWPWGLLGALIWFCLGGWGEAPAHAAPPTATNVLDSTQAIVAFDAANKFYEQGRFSEAAEAYQRIIEGGQRSTAVFFNAGNAWFKAGQIGRAIAAYRQAQRLSPRDPGVQFNLNFARKRVTSGEPAPPLLDRTLAALTVNEWTMLAAGFLWASLCMLALGELRETFRPTARRYAILGAIATLAFAAGAGAATSRAFHPVDGVVVVPSAVVRSGPLEDAKVLHQLRDGTEVKILDQKKLSDGGRGQTWFQVKNSGAQAGWVKEDQLAVVR